MMQAQRQTPINPKGLSQQNDNPFFVIFTKRNPLNPQK